MPPWATSTHACPSEGARPQTASISIGNLWFIFDIFVSKLDINLVTCQNTCRLEPLNAVKADDDGLTARFLTVFPEQVPLTRPSGQLDEAFAVDAFRRLHALQAATDEYGAQRPFFIHFDEAAQVALQEFRKQCREWEAFASGLMKSHIGKLPGLAVRVTGDITRERLELLREADEIVLEEIVANNLYRSTSQVFAVLLAGTRAVGVMGDGRTYDYVVAVRAVETQDFMTADWARLPYDVLATISNRIINEVRGINRVCYDISSKPPATIEWE